VTFAAGAGRSGPSEAAAVRTRFTLVAILLHWAVAASVLGLLASGLWMARAIRDPAQQAQAFEVYQLHKAFGLLVLVLTLLRLVWRLTHPPPPLPAGTPHWQRAASHAVHLALYGLTIVVPLLGWLTVSASPLGFPTVPFGLFEWPHLPVAWLGTDPEALEDWSKLGHRTLAYVAAGAIALHIGAALKHQFVDRDGLVGRMGFGQVAPLSAVVARPGVVRDAGAAGGG